jgi:hypothetical protein
MTRAVRVCPTVHVTFALTEVVVDLDVAVSGGAYLSVP